jgi:hypothetical protein
MTTRTLLLRPTLLAALAVLMAGWILSSCYYDNELELYGDAPVECDSIGTFMDNVKPIIEGNCATPGCHVAGGGAPGLMENYTQIKSFVDNGLLEQRALINKDMPPSGPLTECQQQLLQTWIDAGAPDN